MDSRQAAIEIIMVLRSHGFEALLAGGCVRDMLLGHEPKDYDVATDAQPDQVIRLFRRTLKIGAKFGVVVVLIDGQQIEVATFRQDLGYDDGRRPTSVRFSSAREDALRRDFTINGMFYDPLERKVIDYVEGQADLKARIIRTIGSPEQRFAEDYLRMLRAIRFSAQLGFGIEPNTYQAICSNASKIVQISGERISMELEGILTSRGRAGGISLMVSSGVAGAIFPGLDRASLEKATVVLSHMRGQVCYPLGLAGMFAFCQTEAALDACEVLRPSRSQVRHLRFLLEHRGVLTGPGLTKGQLRLLMGQPYFWDLYALQKAIERAKKADLGPLVRVRRMIRELAGVEIRPKPLLDGHDLMRLGIEPGPALGRIAERLYMAQLEGQIKDKDQARQLVLQWLAGRA